MYCNKCGKKAVEGAEFCQSCGTQIKSVYPENKTIITDEPNNFPPPPVPPFPVPPKKKKGKTILIAAGSIILFFIVIGIISSGGGDGSGGGNTTDHVMTLKHSSPAESLGISDTYYAVIYALMNSPSWNERVQSNELSFVDLQGGITDIDGTDLNIVLTFRVTPVEARENVFFYEAIMLEIDESFYNEEAASEFVSDLFLAYDGGYRSIAAYYQSLGIDIGIAQWYRQNY